ncbi:hypothetical protein [Rathayibacter rathayi]|uniref:hypothetical protein n=1 Tax=Rathayibacter rathayi TaxID=33887 RepID=UPI0011B0DCDB|nr:hypothetical protein [Rathayibacter rathayi]
MTDDAHAMAANSAWLWRNAQEFDADHFYARPWTSLTASGGLRTFVLKQCRANDDLGADRDGLSSEFAAFNKVIERWVHGTGIRRLQGIAILNALSATASFPSLPSPDASSPDPIEIHTAYEFARGLRARNPFSAEGSRLMNEIVYNDQDPRLALMAVVNLITLLVRFDNDEESARSYLPRGEDLSRRVSSGDEWLDWHVVNNWHRVKALLALRSKDYVETMDELAAADEADKGAVVRALDGYAKHIISQSHMLLVGVKVRFETRSTCNPHNVRNEIHDLTSLAPYDFEQQPAIGDLFAGADDFSEAAARYRSGAQGGAVQGAIAAFRAYECSSRIGDIDAAERDLKMLRDLDAHADVHHYTTR